MVLVFCTWNSRVSTKIYLMVPSVTTILSEFYELYWNTDIGSACIAFWENIRGWYPEVKGNKADIHWILFDFEQKLQSNVCKWSHISGTWSHLIPNEHRTMHIAKSLLDILAFPHIPWTYPSLRYFCGTNSKPRIFTYSKYTFNKSIGYLHAKVVFYRSSLFSFLGPLLPISVSTSCYCEYWPVADWALWPLSHLKFDKLSLGPYWNYSSPILSKLMRLF